MKGGLVRAAVLGGVLLAWAGVTYGNRAVVMVNPVLLPTPGDVLAVFVESIVDGSLPRHVGSRG